MKNVVFFILTITLITGCNQNSRDDSDKMSPLFPEPQSTLLDTKGGFVINQVSKDSIQPLISGQGDTIRTGVPILAIEKNRHIDSVSKPIVVPVFEPDSIVSTHTNAHKIPQDLVQMKVNLSSLKTFTPGVDTSSFALISEEGDTIPTGEPISAKGKIVITAQPQPVKALSPAFHDDASCDIQYLDMDQGMTSSSILSILEDSRGNLWFGTMGGGVSRYDGQFFTHFTKKEGLSDNSVWSILEDSQGNMWFGTGSGGVSRYDGVSFTHFTQKNGLSDNSVYSILEDRHGNLWFGTMGGGVSRYDGEFFTHFTKKQGLSNNYVWSMLEDSKGNLWFGTVGGGVCRYDGESFTTYTKKQGLSNNYIWSMLEDNQGKLWFGTFGGGVCQFDGESFTHYTKKQGLSNNYIWSMFEDRKGDLWFGSKGGVSRYDGKFFTHFTEEEGLSHSVVLSILEDSRGNLWFGTDGGGVNRYDRKSFTHFTKKQGLSDNYVISMLEDSQGNLWFGTYGGGVNKYNEESLPGGRASFAQFKNFTVKKGLSGNAVWSMLEDSHGNIWFGTMGGGVSRYDGKSLMHYTKKQGLSNQFVYSMMEDSHGNIWFGTKKGGVSRYNGESHPGGKASFTNFMNLNQNHGLSGNAVRSILEDSRGNIWFGSKGGVSRFDGKFFTHFTEKEGLSNNVVLSILEDRKGDLWFGTNGGGLSRFDGKTFRHFTQKEGLSNNYIMSLQEDGFGNLWLSTNSGLNKMMFGDGEISTKNNLEETNKVTPQIISFSKKDGLKGLNFSRNSVCLDSKNRIWWGGTKGLEMLDMNNFSIAKNPPKVRLNSIDINEQFIDYHSQVKNDSLGFSYSGDIPFYNYPENLKLDYDKNHLTFHFSAIDWSAPHKIQYSYRLLGHNDKWSMIRAETKADYRNIPYDGTYIFQIRAIGESGAWSEAFEYEFTIYPPWWQTWWARTGYGIMALLLIMGIVRWRTAKLKQRQKELETEVKIATREIREQKEEIEEQHMEIKDSINYAKRIQNAILPPVKLVKEYLKDSFILYKPKDIVAGDFYWFETRDDEIYLAAADCTGHGVPGAMVSVVCANALNRAVNEMLITEPAKILDKTRELVVETFEKSEEDVKDGMDISFCRLNLKTRKLSYSGAHNPLYRITPIKDVVDEKTLTMGSHMLIEYKGDKQPIGKFAFSKPFTQEEIQLLEGDTIYLSSDGYPDQFGGEKGRKFMYKPFKKLFLSIHNEHMDKQKEILADSFDKWKGEHEQVDDVCVIGVKV